MKEILSQLYARDRERAGKYPMPKHAIRSSRSRDKPVSGWSKSKRQIDLLAAKVRTTDDGVDPATMTDAEILEKYGIQGWKLHDIRRSLATHIRKEGASREATKWILGHVDGSITAIYDRASHLPEKGPRVQVASIGEVPEHHFKNTQFRALSDRIIRVLILLCHLGES